MECSVLDPFQQLEVFAILAARDIGADFPNHDTSYDLYVEDLSNLDGDAVIVGVISMGDLWSIAYEWVDGSWHPSGRDPFVTIEEILAKRDSRNF